MADAPENPPVIVLGQTSEGNQVNHFQNDGPDYRFVAELATDDEGQANARRIAACWNTCQGISTEALEAGAVAKLVEALQEIEAGCYNLRPGHVGAEDNRTKAQIQAIAREALAPFTGEGA